MLPLDEFSEAITGCRAGYHFLTVMLPLTSVQPPPPDSPLEQLLLKIDFQKITAFSPPITRANFPCPPSQVDKGPGAANS